MSLQTPVMASQRCHWEAYVMVGVPVQLPVFAVSVCPSSATPESAGATVLAGGSAATVALAADDAVLEPPGPVAVTCMTSVPPTSAGTAVYLACVAPVMSAQAPPLVSQRRHW